MTTKDTKKVRKIRLLLGLGVVVGEIDHASKKRSGFPVLFEFAGRLSLLTTVADFESVSSVVQLSWRRKADQQGYQEQRLRSPGCSMSGKESKAFFSEEKKQKTFGPAVAESPSARAQGNKSFLVLFFKKELLALPVLGRETLPWTALNRAPPGVPKVGMCKDE